VEVRVTAPDTVPELDTDLRRQVVESMTTLLPRVLRRELPDLAEDTSLFDELGLSSVTTLELLLELEEALEIQVDVEGIDQDDLRSVGSLADFVTGHAVTDE
jgi:acyl carrier protein